MYSGAHLRLWFGNCLERLHNVCLHGFRRHVRTIPIDNLAITIHQELTSSYPRNNKASDTEIERLVDKKRLTIWQLQQKGKKETPFQSSTSHAPSTAISVATWGRPRADWCRRHWRESFRWLERLHRISADRTAWFLPQCQALGCRIDCTLQCSSHTQQRKKMSDIEGR